MTRARTSSRAPVSARPPAVAWDWADARIGAVYAVPALVGALFDVRAGLALAVGVLPVAIAGVPAARNARFKTAALGALTGIALFIGGLLATVPVLAVAAMAGLGPLTAWLAARGPAGQIAMTLTYPLVGIGLSYSDLERAGAAGALMIAGALIALPVLMLVPPRSAPAASKGAARPAAPTLGYGVRLGAAAATAAATGFALDLEHVGWATGAALLVMRPAAEMQRLRSAGRVLSVIAGALIAVAFTHAEPANVVYGVAASAAVVVAAATHHSRWYVTPAATTFLVFLLLLGADPETAGARFGERVGETLLGVGLAYLFGLALPGVLRWLRLSRRP